MPAATQPAVLPSPLPALDDGAPEVPPAPTPSPSPSPVPVADAAPETPKVFAHYMGWFEGPPSWRHWKWTGHDPEVLDEAGLRQIAAARHPAIGPYDSTDDAVIGYHLLLMHAAGFDGAILNWYGFDSHSDRAARALMAKSLDWARRYGLAFSVMLMPDAGAYQALDAAARITRLGEDLERVLDDYGESPVYQRLAGKPVLFFFPKPDPQAPSQTLFTPEHWLTIRKDVSRPFLLAHEHPNADFKQAAELAYGWITLGADSQDYGGKGYLDWLYPTFAFERSKGWPLPVFVGVTFPGFDDGGVYSWSDDPSQRRLIDRTIGGQPTLGLTWERIETFNRDHPDTAVRWVQTATWNDWNEGSEIEPSVELGTQALALAAQKNHAFRGTTAPPAATWDFAERYFAARQAGKADADVGEALAHYLVGRYDEALAALP